MLIHFDNSKACLVSAMLIFLVPMSSLAQHTENGGFISQQEGLKGLFDALSSRMDKPIILSKVSARKKLTGEFDLEQPQAVLAATSRQLGLIWYDDGQAIYIYDASEIRNAVVVLENISFNVVKNFLINSKLYDSRYPLKGSNRDKTFYVSGPPVYTELVLKLVKNLDRRSGGFQGRENIAVIPLFNTFVDDRIYQFRTQSITIPGISSVINRVISKIARGGTVQITPEKNNISNLMPDLPESAPDSLSMETNVSDLYNDTGMSIIAEPGSNSLLVRGSSEQLAYIRNLVEALDTKKRHIELSVWIVDFQKDAFEKLGVEWTGGINVGSLTGVGINGGTSTIDGASFMATAMALSEKNQATIVSRPMILTQENVPAMFDNNRTFYSKLIGERTAQLQNITYGTSINVLPRFTQNGEVEMMLNVEDGNQYGSTLTTENELPEIGRTSISTIARVPKGKSLLIGGYTRDEDNRLQRKIPLLGDIPWIGGIFRYNRDRASNMIRVFLIQPREIGSPLVPDANELIKEIKKNFSQDRLQNWMENYLDSQT